MSAASGVLLLIGFGASAYAVLGGADFGAGLWWATTARRGRARERELLSRAIGPVWEANHVWLIFTVIATLSAFPAAYADLSRRLQVPIAVGLAGIVIRGAGFVFATAGAQRWAAPFAAASVVTPFAWGVALGDIAAGREHPVAGGFGAAFPLAAGALAVSVSGYLAAVFLAAGAGRLGFPWLVDTYRWRALATGTLSGVLAIATAILGGAAAPGLHQGRAAVFIAVSATAGVAGLVLLWSRRFGAARLAASAAAASVVWGWAAAQYPLLVPPRLTVAAAAAPPAAVHATLAVTVGGLALTLPALAMLFRTFGRELTGEHAAPASGDTAVG
jgi:cytochrome d ubiquinol oxidase subunit II